MKTRLVLFLLCVSLVSVIQARAETILPDACGDDKTKFDVDTQRDIPVPAGPAADKAQIVFIEKLDGSGSVTTPTTRFGIDGAWVRADKDNSYFVVSVAPGPHHLCVNWQSHFGSESDQVAMDSFTAEAGKTYYYQIKITRLPRGGNNIDIFFNFTQLNEDEGKYRIKASMLSTSSPKKAFYAQ